MPDHQPNRDTVRRLWEAFEAREREDAMALLATDLIVEWPRYEPDL